MEQLQYINPNSEIRNTIPFLDLNFNCPILKKKTKEGWTFTVRTIRNWNELSADLKKVKTLKTLKRNLVISFK